MPRPESGTDVYVYNALDKVVPFFCKYNIHPNVITIGSLLSNKILFEALKNIPKNKTLICALMLSHGILDCLDGEVARGCKKYSELGSMLDFVNDHIFSAICFCALINKYSKLKYNIKNISLIFFFLYYINVFIGKVNPYNHTMNHINEDSSLFNQFGKTVHDNSVLAIMLGFYIIVK